MNNLRNNRGLFFLLLVPLFSFLWHFENLQLPISDSVEYLDSAYSIYLFFHNGEYLNFIISIFNERGWRPIAFQLFIVPFLIIFSGNILMSILMTHVLFNSISAFFIYKILKKFISSEYSTIVSVLILSLSFNIFFGGQPLPLFAEISFIAFLLGAIYFLLKIDLFRNKSDTRLFTLFFSLTLLVRPVEGIIFLVPVLLLFTWKNYSNYVTAREMLQAFLYPLFFVWLLFISRIFPEVSSSVIKIDPPNSLNIFINLTMIISLLLFLISICLLILRYKKNFLYKKPQQNFFKRSLLFSSLILWVWYTPRFGSLYGWVYDTSIGDTFDYLKNDIPEFSSLFFGILQNNGPIIIYLLLFLLFATIFINFKNSKKILVTSENLKKEIINLNYLLASALPLPILLYFTTHQITYRKISPAVVLLLIYLLVIIFQNKNIKKVANISLSIFLLVQVFSLSNLIFSKEKVVRWNNQDETFIKKNILGYQFPKPINSGYNRYDKLISFIKEETDNYSYKKITLVLKDDEYPIERYLFKFMCRTNNLECSFFYPKKFGKKNFSELETEELLLLILSDNEYVTPQNLLAKKISLLINKNFKKMSIADLNTYHVLYLLTNELLSTHNFQSKKCYNFVENYHACLIKKNN